MDRLQPVKRSFVFRLLLIFSLVLPGLTLSAQSVRKVTGKVTYAEDGQPIIGAAVLVDGHEQLVTVTDLDGNFTLEGVPEQAKTLTISYLGVKDKTLPISDKPMDIRMESEAQQLEGVIVTGMQKVDRRLFTGAATKVEASEAKLDGMADVSRSLEGRVAGVSVQNVSGTFGTAPKIRVRGATSIYGSSKPLWVVDGVIMEDVVEVSADQLSSGDANTLISSAIAGLNSDDIESFDILKDGSATSIYGARAMAGVIVVTTKRGKAGSAQVGYTGEYSVRLKPSYRTFNILSSQDQIAIYQELDQKGYLNYAETSNAADSGVYGKMYQLLTQYDPANKTFALDNTPQAKAAYLRAAEYRNTDWFDRLFRHSLQHNHSVSVSGGTEKATYYTSLSVMDDPGWTLQSRVNRYTANMNTSVKISPALTLTVISNAAYRRQRAPGTLSGNIDAVSGEVTRSFDINPYSFALNTSRTLDPDEFYTRNFAPFNIFHELDNNYIDLSVVDLRFQGELKYKPTAHLELSGLGAIKHSSTSQAHHILDDSNQAQAYRAMGTSTIRSINSYLYTDPDNPYALPVSVLPNGGIYERTNNAMYGYDLRATATYSNTFHRDHIINLYGGSEVNLVDRTSDWFRGWGLQYSMGEVANYAYQVFKKSSEQNTQYFTLNNRYDRIVAFFANATYSYQGRYTLNGTTRYEGTNRLGKARSARWLPTWNVAASWNIHEEEFMRGLYPTLSHLSLKSSYSLTADRGPANVTNSYVVISSDTPWRPYAVDRESELYIADVANNDLTYEKKHELNIGLEAGLLDNRINLALDWYKRDNFDLIGIVHTKGLGGQIAKFGNIAAMRSDGFEVSLSTNNLRSERFSWTTNLIYSHSHNVVTRLNTTKRVIDLVQGGGFAQEGYPVRSVFSIPFMGLNQEGLPTFKDQDGNVSVTGVYFQESDPEALKFLEYSGSADPTDVGSLGNIFTWNGLRLNVFITYSLGNVIRLDPVFRSSYNDLDAMPKEFLDRWVQAGDEEKTDVPAIASRIQNRRNTNLSIAYNAYNYSTARIASGNFVRMKELSLSYDLPKDWVHTIGLSTASLKLQGTNLFLIYADPKLNGQDPEFFNTGGVAVPVPKQFTLTLRLGL
ncbi:MAG: SusC/RagA family TonB-linked outer membrane protein [Bacteroidales bacterium]|nr:SusC/RagA family TonB-linked outer membrane protein [Bacteroidales bacterium]